MKESVRCFWETTTTSNSSGVQIAAPDNKRSFTEQGDTSTSAPWPVLSRSSVPLNVIAILLVFCALHVAASLLVPVACAILLSMMLAPPVQSLEKLGVPRPLASALVVLSVTRTGVVVGAAKLGDYHEFAGLKAFGRIEAQRTIDGKTETDVRIFALSRKLTVEEFMASARAHWEIENKLHWGLDVAMREDDARNRRDHGPANLAVLRRRARDVAARDTAKGSLSIKLKRAGWNENYLIELLHHMR